MYLTLDEPYSVGDLAPDVTYPHVYVTTFYVNGPAASLIVTYEVGTYDTGTWTRSPFVPTQTMTFDGAQLVPFFGSMPTDTATPLWSQVEALIYQEIALQDERMKGTVS